MRRDRSTQLYGISRKCFLDFWAQAFALDYLISNTDRHAENWGIIEGRSGARMAPLYDNVSSLGCGLDQTGLDKAFDQNQGVSAAHIERQRKNGCHHIRAREPAKKGHLSRKSARSSSRSTPRAGAGSMKQLMRILMDLIGKQSEFDDPYRLSAKRQKHVNAMLRIGQERIRNVIARSKSND